ncbi:hypothetical protein [Marinobacter sp. C2H3]|uniref:hypothetical protein n=1 Tax=Marinobacter sp. C2H3 TaxID=3119003 RepID=UPI00300E79C0
MTPRFCATRVARTRKAGLALIARRGLLMFLALGLPAAALAASKAGPDTGRVAAGKSTVALGIDGITASTGEDEPRLLVILPWQPPTLPGRARVELPEDAPMLERPLDPRVIEHHRRFRESLDPDALTAGGPQP